MVHGKVVEKLAQIYENDEGGIVGGGSEPVDERTECPKSKPNSNIMRDLVSFAGVSILQAAPIYFCDAYF